MSRRGANAPTGERPEAPQRKHAEDAAHRIVTGDVRALARALTWLEAGDARGASILAEARVARTAARGAWRVGITGTPGGGKSTLADRLVELWRGEGLRVAVLAVDPSSTFTGGAILGDRVRMTRWHDDPGVFVRSMASRGRLGGLADASVAAAALLEMAGYERVLIETVGVGQSEVDVAAACDTTLLVLTPGGGDGIQAVKAGVLEIADVIVVNKRDLPGAQRLRRDLEAAQTLVPLPEEAWRAPVLLTAAHDGEGLKEVAEVIERHRSWRTAREDAEDRARRLARAELAAAVRARTERLLRAHADAWLDEIAAGTLSARAAAERLLPSPERGGDDDAVASEP